MRRGHDAGASGLGEPEPGGFRSDNGVRHDNSRDGELRPDSIRPDDVHMVRNLLRDLVDDVEERPDALARMLATTRRRHSRRRPVLSVGALAAVTAAVFLVALFVIPDGPVSPPQPQPVDLAPNEYVAQPDPGALDVFDVSTGHEVRSLARLHTERAGALAVDGNRVYAVTTTGGRDGILEARDGTAPQQVEPPGTPITALTAAAGMIAYSRDGSVTVARDGGQQHLAVPEAGPVLDLALGPDGRLAVLTRQGIQVIPAGPGTGNATPRMLSLSTGGCAPIAVAWSEGQLAALQQVRCEPAAPVRIARVDPAKGELVGGGVPFDVGVPGQVRLSTDRLGRLLVSKSGGQQWLVDGTDVRPVPPACTQAGRCAAAPGVF